MHYLTKFCSFQSSGSPVHCLDKRYFLSVFLTDVTGVDVSGLDSIGLNEFQILLILYLYEPSGGGVIRNKDLWLRVENLNKSSMDIGHLYLNILKTSQQL